MQRTSLRSGENLLEVRFHPELIGELSTRLYSDRFAPVRELIANSWDEDARHVRVQLREDSITFQDDGNGIVDPQQFLTKGDPSKKERLVSKIYRRRLVGQKGLGVLSVFMMGDKCEVTTKTGKNRGFKILLDKSRMLSDLTAVSLPLTRFDIGSSSGTLFKIMGLSSLYSSKEISNYIGVAFRPQLGVRFKISVNGKSIKPPPLPKGKVYSKIVRLGKGRTLRANLIDPERSEERVAVLHYNPILVKSIRLQERPHLTGYLETDFLRVRTDRSEFLRDEEYKRFERGLHSFIKDIPPSTEMAGKRLLRNLRRISRLLVGVINEIGLPITGSGKAASGLLLSLPSGRKISNQEERVSILKRKSRPIGRRIRVRFYSLSPQLASRLPRNIAKGVNIECHELSPSEPPVQRTSGNTIIINLSFPHIGSLLRLPEEGREFALIPYVARGYAEFITRDPSELMEVADHVTAELTNRYLQSKQS